MYKDRIGREVCVDDTVVFVRRNKLELGRVIKLCGKQCAITWQSPIGTQDFSDVVHVSYSRVTVVVL